ncbi:TetR/AcrR family transcriptional regulator [Sodalis ligni]|uniref:TetR/AcrR family transcriptional regulator n=1 Tax=Sodalis TaxID=84565 RepID=UPI00193F0822|nr:TetR/AcrR family transcriptional regulator [Sodalis ligni]QWA11675.1 TetR/AcrR family transcriptional regulator [Sodalis ligni]
MARPKEFNRETALACAIRVFAEHGYEGTSTEALLQAMRISRQSMYDTFGDKRRLFLEALQRYCFESIGTIAAALRGGGSPLAGIEAALLSFALRAHASSESGCLGVNALCEFGRRDREVTAIGDASGAALQHIFESAIKQAIVQGEIAADVQPQEAALFLNATFIALKVMARGGADPEALRSITRTALRSLK